MSKLTVTADQEAGLVVLEDDLEMAFANGVQDESLTPVLDPLPLYSDPAVIPEHQGVKDPFKALIAAMMVTLNIPRALPVGLTTTVILAKLTPSGSQGQLTFEDGLLVAKTDPS